MDLRTLKGVLTRIKVALKGVFSFSGRLLGGLGCLGGLSGLCIYWVHIETPKIP